MAPNKTAEDLIMRADTDPVLFEHDNPDGGEPSELQQDTHWKIELLRLDALLKSTKEKILQTITPYSLDQPIQANELLSLTDIQKEAETLLADSDQTVSEFLMSSARLVEIITIRLRKAELADANAFSDESQASTELWTVQSDLHEFNKQSKIKKFFDGLIPSRSVRLSIEQRKDVAIKRQSHAQDEMRTTEETIQTLKKIRDSLTSASDKKKTEQIKETLSDMRKAHTSFLHDLVSDPCILAELRGPTLVHVFAMLTDPEQQQNSAAAKFKEILSGYMSGGVFSFDDIQKIYKSLSEISWSNTDQLMPNNLLQLSAKAIQDTENEELFTVAVSSFIGERISSFADDLSKHIPTNGPHAHLLKKEVDRMMASASWSEFHYRRSYTETARKNPDLIALQRLKLERHDMPPDSLVSVWQTIRELPVISELFPKESQDLTEKIIQKHIAGAASDTDGFSIDKMINIPSPEVVRALLLLSAGETGGYRRQHAFGVLHRLSGRPEWQTLLDETIKAYPELEKGRTFLETFSKNSYTGPYDIYPLVPIIRTNISQLVHRANNEEKLFGIPENSKESAAWKGVTFQAMNTDDLLHALKTNKLFDAQIVSQLSVAIDTIYTWSKKELAEHARAIDLSVLDAVIRNNYLGPVLWDKGESDVPGMARKLSQFSRAVETNKDNDPVLEYLTSSSVTDMLKHSYLTAGQLDVILTAHEMCPQLISDGRLRYEFLSDPEQNALFTSEGITFLAQFFNAYSAYPQAQFYYLRAVRKGAISFHDTLALPKKRPELCSQEYVALLESSPVHFEFLLTASPEEVEAFLSYSKGSTPRLDLQQDKHFGERLSITQSKGLFDTYTMQSIIRSRLTEYFSRAHSVEELHADLTEQWPIILEGFIAVAMEDQLAGNITADSQKALQSLFEDAQVKNFCLEQVRMLWRAGLETRDPDSVPFSLCELTSHIRQCEGAGPLKHIEALGQFAQSLKDKFSKKTDILPNTHKRIFDKQRTLEQRLDKER